MEWVVGYPAATNPGGPDRSDAGGIERSGSAAVDEARNERSEAAVLPDRVAAARHDQHPAPRQRAAEAGQVADRVLGVGPADERKQWRVRGP